MTTSRPASIDRQLVRLKYGLRGIIPGWRPDPGVNRRASKGGLLSAAGSVHPRVARRGCPSGSKILHGHLTSIDLQVDLRSWPSRLNLDSSAQTCALRLTFGARACFGPCGRPGFAENPDDSLLVYAVNIHRTPVQTWVRERDLSRQRIVHHGSPCRGPDWITRPKVVIEGQEYPTLVVKEGAFEQTDLTLLSVDEEFLPSRLRLAAQPAVPRKLPGLVKASSPWCPDERALATCSIQNIFRAMSASSTR